jgi:hypothetical protein
VSLESFNYPGRFVRHFNSCLFIHKREEAELYEADATFRIEQER